MKKTMIGSILCILLLSISLTACSNNPSDITSNFQDSVFLGDSVAYGLLFNEILPEENVQAGAGATAGFLYEDIDKLAARTPKKVYILIGQCDLLMPVDDPLSLFRDDYTKLVQAILDKLPDCEIYLQSITPVTKDAVSEESRYGQISDYNETIKSLAEELSVEYIDLNPLVEEHKNLYAEDGIHFQKEFYPLWLEYLTQQD